MTRVLELTRVRHRYGTLTALDGVDLSVRAGECVALPPLAVGRATSGSD